MMGAMDALISFMNARLDEAEALATEAAKYNPSPWATDDLGDLRDAKGAEIFAGVGYGGTSFYESAAQFAGRFDPAHVLREVAAKRAIIAEYEASAEFMNRPENRHIPAGEPHGLYTALKILAAVYSDHPDYDPAWKP
jgi:hypothetical protein